MVTMADVARVAGVSPSTVSHVLNGTRAVHDDTRAAVLEAIAATRYRRNAVAASLATSRTTTVGLANSVANNVYFAELVRSVARSARGLGYDVLIEDTQEDPEQELRVLQQLVDRRVDGVLLVPSRGAEREALPFLRRQGVPVVLLDRFVDAEVDQVAPENEASTRLLTEHLADLGHTRVGVVVGLRGIASSEERLRGHLGAVADRGLDASPELVVDGRSDVDAAEGAVLRLMSSPAPPTALVVGNNTMTIGTLRALRALGLRVPQDVALVCFDDFEWSDLFEPRLTAISQDVPALGARGLELVLQRIGGSTAAPRRERVATAFRHRTSCGCGADDADSADNAAGGVPARAGAPGRAPLRRRAPEHP
ncbi:LacI family DNA-binding transcriptional regulator [Kineococcus sp. SYSU DK005]|uniref:LacI family DNA-binding transcriptional regulator n=1 Tax=Kineococcus sp. SYSU DK005 TaxID=3383126 RepID=UPI003D7C9DEF